MKLNLDIDEVLMNKAKELSGSKTKKATVNKALRLLISLKENVKTVKLIENK